MKRRDFLKHSALASTASLIPAFLQGNTLSGLERSRSGKILVVIQLSGGNDSLNTFVPYRNDLYYSNRPRLAISEQEVLPLSDELGLHPSLAPLRSLYEQGHLSLINSVGYPNPDRSHFRSMDIWQTGSGADQHWTSGWLGRYLDSDCPHPHTAIELDDNLSLALKGKEKNGFAVNDPVQLRKTTHIDFLKKLAKTDHHHEEENVAYLYKTLVDTQSSAEYLYRQAKLHRSKVKYPATPLGRDLQQIAELITADTDTRIYYASMGGFDTHVNQKTKHARLLKVYAEAVAALTKDLQQHGLFDDVLIMTFSEFGRRVKQNASGGTDHGTAGNVSLIGGKLRKAGIYNSAPDLSQLDQGDLIYQVDFRRIYAELLDNWIDGDPRQVLNGTFKKLGILG